MTKSKKRNIWWWDEWDWRPRSGCHCVWPCLSLSVSPFWSARLRFFCILSPEKDDDDIPTRWFHLSLSFSYSCSRFLICCVRGDYADMRIVSFSFENSGWKNPDHFQHRTPTSSPSSSTSTVSFLFLSWRSRRCRYAADRQTLFHRHSPDVIVIHPTPNRLENLLAQFSSPFFSITSTSRVPLLVTCRPIPIGHSTPPRLLRFFRKFLNGIHPDVVIRAWRSFPPSNKEPWGLSLLSRLVSSASNHDRMWETTAGGKRRMRPTRFIRFIRSINSRIGKSSSAKME